MDAGLTEAIAKAISQRGPELRTFGDMLALYVSKSPAFSYQYHAQVMELSRDLGGVPLRHLAQGLEAYLAHRRVHPGPRGKVLSDASCNRKVQVVRAAWNLCHDLELVGPSPITKARFPRFKEYARDRYLTPDELERLWKVLDREAPHLLAVTQFALQVPCRKSELGRMRREKVDFEGRAIWVPNGTTKNGDGCWKPIPPDMYGYFASHPRECPWVFYRLGWYGEYLPLGDFKRAWKRALRLAEINDFQFRDTRHISATDMLNLGTPERVVMDVGNWKVNMFRTYYHKAGRTNHGLVRWKKAG